MIAAVTGHRPQSLDGDFTTCSPLWRDIARRLDGALITYEVHLLISGMALGVDLLAVERARRLGISYAAYLPYPDHERRWPPHQQRRYHSLLADAASVHLISEGSFSPAKLHRRNRALVAPPAALLLAVWDGRASGGTAATVAYARQRGVMVRVIPVSLLGGGPELSYGASHVIRP